jgi:integrase-like protein
VPNCPLCGSYDRIPRQRIAGTQVGVDFTAGEIHLSRGIVRQHIGGMKTEASRKPVPLDAGLADVLLGWRQRCPYNQDADYIFGSPDKNGTQPYWPNAAMEDYVRPAAKQAGIQKRIGWHTLRHTYGTLVKSQGADVATTQALYATRKRQYHDGQLRPSRDASEAGSTKPSGQFDSVSSVPTSLTETAVTG